MIEIFEQSEFRGLAREGSAQDDPFSSRMELNTETQDDSLNRLRGRQPYIASRFPANAFYFDEINKSLVAYNYGGVRPTLTYSNTAFEAVVCFKWDGLKDVGTVVTTRNIFGGIDGSNYAWGVVAYYSASVWKACGIVAQTSSPSVTNAYVIPTTATISPGTWYWAKLAVSANNGTLTLYSNGSGTPIETVTNSSLARNALTGSIDPHPYIGGIPFEPTRQIYRGAVSYAAVGPTSSTPDPWNVKIAREGQTAQLDLSFCVQNPKEESYIAKIATASASALSWVTYPQRELKFTTATAIVPGNGIVFADGEGAEVTIPSESLFSQRTVFMFYASNLGTYCPLIRSEDSTFRIEGFSSASYLLAAAFNPASATAGTAAMSRMIQPTANLPVSSVNHWLAFEFSPNVSASTNNVNFYMYSASTWTSFLTATSYTFGIVPPEGNKYIIGGNGSYAENIYDFRVSVGDDSWKVNNTPTATYSMAPGLVMWLNNRTGLYPRDDNIGSFSTKNTDALKEKVIAISSRTDGEYRCKLSSHRQHNKFVGCQYLSGGFTPQVEDIMDFGSGNLSGVTDGYYFETNGTTFTTKPIYSGISKKHTRLYNIGLNKYVCGPGPLQYVGRRTRLVGLPKVMVVPYIGANLTEAGATLTYRGKLQLGTEYKYKLTLYNPETGDESNPHGPFTFFTDTGSAECAFVIGPYFCTNVDLDGLEFRAYRYLTGDGLYHLDGTAKINGIKNASGMHYSEGTFTFTLSDEELALQPVLHTEDYQIPEHKYCTVWNNRSWLVDTYNPSRVFYSREYELGNVPTTNFLWTDEGLTGEIIGLMPGFGGLLVLKERSIWIIPYFATDEEATCQQLVPDVGVVGGDAAVFVDGILYFASSDGLYIFNGQTTERISKSLNKADLVVWDHDPLSTRAYYDRRNFKVVFWNDGSFVSIDVRNGAIRLGASNDRCVATISSTAYSGPVYGGSGVVYKETDSTNAIKDFNGNTLRTYDDFGASTQQTISVTTATETYAGFSFYTLNASNATNINTNVSSAGFLTIQLDGAAAHYWGAATSGAPIVYQKHFGDSDISAINVQVPGDGGRVGLAVFNPSDVLDFSCVELVNDAGVYSLSAYDNASSVLSLVGSISGTVGTAASLRVKRQGTSVSFYRYNGTTLDWDLIATVTKATFTSDVLNYGLYLKSKSDSTYSGIAKVSSFSDTDRLNTETIVCQTGSYGPVSTSNALYTSALNWHWTDGNLGSGAKRVGGKFTGIWCYENNLLGDRSVSGREFIQWNTARNDIWETIIHSQEAGRDGVFYYITKQSDLSQFFIGRVPFYYLGQNIYVGRRADPKIFERLEIITDNAKSLATTNRSCNIKFTGQLHGESAAITTTASVNLPSSANNLLPVRTRGNYYNIEIEGYTSYDIEGVKMFRVHYRPIRPRGRLK